MSAATKKHNDLRGMLGRTVKRLAKDRRVQLVYWFGSSRVRPHAARDVDLGILFSTEIDSKSQLWLQADLGRALGHRVDLISLSRVPVILRHEVVANGECVFARSDELALEFVLQTHKAYWDFLPFVKEQWRNATLRAQKRIRHGTAG